MSESAKPMTDAELQATLDNSPFISFLGLKVTEAGELDEAVRQALAHDGPALVDVDVDPDEPPMPGKVSYDQAKNFAQAFLRGQPRRASIATTLFKDKISQLRSG